MRVNYDLLKMIGFFLAYVELLGLALAFRSFLTESAKCGIGSKNISHFGYASGIISMRDC